MSKDDWSQQICEMHLLNAKIRISNILHDNFVSNGKDLDKLKLDEFINKQTLRTNIAIQLLSICFELTEDLAATCFSYAKALKSGDKKVPEYLRDFGDPKKGEAGTPSVFYKTAGRDICYAAEMAGVDPIIDVGIAITHEQFFRKVRDFREKYDDWYQGYKHGQRTLPIYSVPIGQEPSNQNITFSVYRIPQTLQEKDTKVFVEPDVLDIIKEEESIFILINEIYGIWQGVKQRQFPKVFPPPPAPPAALSP